MGAVYTHAAEMRRQQEQLDSERAANRRRSRFAAMMLNMALCTTNALILLRLLQLWKGRVESWHIRQAADYKCKAQESRQATQHRAYRHQYLLAYASKCGTLKGLYNAIVIWRYRARISNSVSKVEPYC